MAVVLYHLRLPISGGSLGVDSFFVISGFVITENLLRSEGNLKNKITLFYKKRLRRIFPASFFITCLTLLSAFYFLPRIYLRNYVLDAVSSLFMVANLRFAANGINYLQGTMNESPFLHLWSLGVEEQFYLIWPLLLLTLLKRKKLYCFVVPILFLISVVTTKFHPLLSFFSPTSRAWEFMIGAYIATTAGLKWGRTSKGIIIFFSFLTLFASLIFMNPRTNTFTLTALPTVISVGLLIYVGFNIRVFKPIAYIGDLSFSLYLVHWPIIAICQMYYPRITLSRDVVLIIFLGSLITAIFVTEKIENPIRFRRKNLRSRSYWIAACAPFLIVSALAFTNGFQLQQHWSFTLDKSYPIIYKDGCHIKSTTPKVVGCDFGHISSNKLVMLVGDSHAAQWFPGFEKAANLDDFRLRVATKSGCPALLTEVTNKSSTSNSNCKIWESKLITYINKSNPNILVISNLTENNGGSFASIGLTPKSYIESLNRFIAQIKLTTKVTVIGDTPYPAKDVVTCLSLNWRKTNVCDVPNNQDLATKLTANLKSPRVNYIDSRPLFCNAEICPAIIGSKNVYVDGSHISPSTINIQEVLANRVLLRENNSENSFKSVVQ